MLPRQRILAGASARRNLLVSPDDLSTGSWTGAATLATPSVPRVMGRPPIELTDASAAAFQSRQQIVTVPADGAAYTLSFLLRRQVGTPAFGVNYNLSGGTLVAVSLRVNPDTGAVSAATKIAAMGDWWRVWSTIFNNGTANTSLTATIFPATNVSGTIGSDSASGTGANIIACLNVVRGAQPLF